MGGGAGTFEAATLVDRDVDEHAPRLHAGDKFIGHEFRCAGTGHENRPDHHVGIEHGPLDLEAVRRDRADPTGVQGVEFTQSLEVRIEHADIRPQSDGDRDGARARHTAAENDDLGRIGAGHSGDEEAGAPIRLQHGVCTDDRSETTCYLAHRSEEWQCARR